MQLQPPEEGQDIAIVDTSLGKITMLLYTDEVPTMVQNFKDLVNQGFYDGQIIFHVEPSIGIAATGSETPDGNGGNSNTGKPIKATYSDNLWPFSGSVSMLCYEAGMLWSKSTYCDSRFFFLGHTEVPEETVEEMNADFFPAMMKNSYIKCGGVPQFGQMHSVFGKVIDGMEVVEAILDQDLTYASINPMDPEASGTPEQMNNNRPLKDVVINTITLSTFHAADFDELDNTLTEDEYEDLVYNSGIEQQEKDEKIKNGGKTPSEPAK